MNKRVTGILLIVVGLWLPGCFPLSSATVRAPVSTPQADTPVPGTSSVTPAAILTLAQGEVRLQQVITGQIVLASFGDHLWRGDVIETAADAQAEAICNDGVPIKVDPEQSVTVTCGETPNPVYDQIIISVHQGQIEALPQTRLDQTESQDLPIILSPRNTFLVERRPTIRWQAVDGAEGYEIVIRKRDAELWRTTTLNPELSYPDGEPALEHGEDYLFQVTAQMETTGGTLPSDEVWVIVLSETEVERVRQYEAQIETLGLSEESTVFFLALYYAELELYDAALGKLIPLVEQTASPLVHRLLGDVYLAIELGEQATQFYQAARELAQEKGNRLLEAEADVGLGHAAYATRAYKEALNHYQAAQQVYWELGLESSANAVAEFVADTKLRLPK